MENDRGPAGEPDAGGRIRLERDGAVATVTIDRPGVRNALNHRLWAELLQAARALSADPEVSCVVLRGEGGNFSAGMDLDEMSRLGPEEVEAAFQVMGEAIAAFETIPVPTIGVVRGVAAGGACQLLLACDLRVASRRARLGMPVARLGITIGPDFGSRLVRAVGAARAREFLFTGRWLRAVEAYRWGLVNEVVADEEADQRAWDLARRIAAQSPAALRAAKAMTAPEAAVVRGDPKGHRYAASPGEFQEGLRAWAEKREPDFAPWRFTHSSVPRAPERATGPSSSPGITASPSSSTTGS